MSALTVLELTKKTSKKPTSKEMAAKEAALAAVNEADQKVAKQAKARTAASDKAKAAREKTEAARSDAEGALQLFGPIWLRLLFRGWREHVVELRARRRIMLPASARPATHLDGLTAQKEFATQRATNAAAAR